MIYEAVCKTCGKKKDYSRTISKRDDTPICCGKPMQRVFSPTRGFVDVPAAR